MYLLCYGRMEISQVISSIFQFGMKYAIPKTPPCFRKCQITKTDQELGPCKHFPTAMNCSVLISSLSRSVLFLSMVQTRLKSTWHCSSNEKSEQTEIERSWREQAREQQTAREDRFFLKRNFLRSLGVYLNQIGQDCPVSAIGTAWGSLNSSH